MSENKNHNITVTMPTGWTDATVFSFLGPQRYGEQAIITLSIEPNPSGHSLEEFAEPRATTLRQQGGDVEVLNEGNTTVAEERQAYEIALRSRSGKTASYQQFLYLIEHGIGYTFALRAGSANWQLGRAALRQMLNTFIFLG